MLKQIMTYATEEIIGALKQAREAKGLSQRALSARTGVPQSHISKIEAGTTDIRISSLIEIARALDLDLKLVPRQAVPAVDTVVRSASPAPDTRSGDTRRELRRLADTAVALRRLYPDHAALSQLQRTLSHLSAHARIGGPDLEALRRATKPLRNLEKLSQRIDRLAGASALPRESLAELADAATPAGKQLEVMASALLEDLPRVADAVQALRNRIAHGPSAHGAPLPAYRLDDDEGDRHA